MSGLLRVVVGVSEGVGGATTGSATEFATVETTGACTARGPANTGGATFASFVDAIAPAAAKVIVVGPAETGAATGAATTVARDAEATGSVEPLLTAATGAAITVSVSVVFGATAGGGAGISDGFAMFGAGS